MANTSIKAAFQRFWQHVVAEIGTRSDSALASAKEYTDSKVGTNSSITYGTEDLEAGVSPLPEGTIYLVYEEE